MLQPWITSESLILPPLPASCLPNLKRKKWGLRSTTASHTTIKRTSIGCAQDQRLRVWFPAVCVPLSFLWWSRTGGSSSCCHLSRFSRRLLLKTISGHPLDDNSSISCTACIDISLLMLLWHLPSFIRRMRIVSSDARMCLRIRAKLFFSLEKNVVCACVCAWLGFKRQTRCACCCNYLTFWRVLSMAASDIPHILSHVCIQKFVFCALLKYADRKNSSPARSLGTGVGFMWGSQWARDEKGLLFSCILRESRGNTAKGNLAVKCTLQLSMKHYTRYAQESHQRVRERVENEGRHITQWHWCFYVIIVICLSAPLFLFELLSSNHNPVFDVKRLKKIFPRVQIWCKPCLENRG